MMRSEPASLPARVLQMQPFLHLELWRVSFASTSKEISWFSHFGVRFKYRYREMFPVHTVQRAE